VKVIPEPAWFQAVLQHTPLPVPPRGPPVRNSFDAHRRALRKTQIRPRALPIVYLEDKVRRQFYKDHPFEALRPRSLVENEGIALAHPIQGKAWTRLRQHGPNPQPEELICFTVCLHQVHHMPLSLAYETAVSQFHSLKSEHHLATLFAVQEAERYGAHFGLREADLNFRKETAALRSWSTQDHEDNIEAALARKRWRAVPLQTSPPYSWSRGEDYVRLWRSGIRPTYTLDQSQLVAPNANPPI